MASRYQDIPEQLGAPILGADGNPIGGTGALHVNLRNSLDQEINSVRDVAGNLNLLVAATQNIFVSVNNSTTTNIAAGASFVGIADDNLNATTIQVNLKCDQPVLVLVLQSNDNINYDFEDRYYLDAGQDDSRVILAVGSFVKIIVTNNGSSATTYINLQTILVPTQSVVPRTLTEQGNLKTAINEIDEFAIIGVKTDFTEFRDDFPGTSLYTNLTGSLVFTHNSPIVTGVGTLFKTEAQRHQYLIKTTDSHIKANYYRILSVDSDAAMTLDRAFTGATQTTSASVTNWAEYVGTSLSVANSYLTLSSGTTNGQFSRIEREGYLSPRRLGFKGHISQRIANQVIRVGNLGDLNANFPLPQACVVFDGTDNTKVKLRVCSAPYSYEVSDTLITLATGKNTTQDLVYEIDITSDSVALLIDQIVVAKVYEFIPDPNLAIEFAIDITNNATVTNTDVLLHRFTYSKTSRLETTNNFAGDPLPVSLIAKNSVTGLPVDVKTDVNGNLQFALAPGASVVPTLGNKLYYDDMNATTGGIARVTTITPAMNWVKIYDYTNALGGLLMSLRSSFVNLTGTATNFWTIRVVVDGTELFGANGISGYDICNNAIYNWNTGTTPSPTWGGLNIIQDTFSWDAPSGLPVTFTSGVQMYVRRIGTVNAAWNAGLVCIVKN